MRFVLSSGAVVLENPDEDNEHLTIAVGGQSARVELSELETALHFAKGVAEGRAKRADRNKAANVSNDRQGWRI